MSRAFFRIVRRYATATKSLEKWYNSLPPERIKEIPLLSSLDQFKASLPVREIDSVSYKIYDQELWAREEDIETMADELERKSYARSAVKYLAAPTQYGKSTFPLRAFLVSALREPKKEQPFQHYIYIAFANNDKRFYRLSPYTPSSELYIAYDQGADFMLKCLEDAINNPSRQGIRKIPLNDKPPSADDTEQACKNLLAKFNGRILIHADEHGAMCDRDSAPRAAAYFSRGALSVLAQIPGVTVLATYTGMPPLPPQHSSHTCRDPVSVPALDVDAVMQAFPELADFQKTIETAELNDSLKGDQKRLWALLRFRLAFKLRTMPLAAVQVRDPEFESFLAEFEVAAAEANLTKALEGLCRLCAVNLKNPEDDPNASKLLLGVFDTAHEEFHLQVCNLVVYKDIVTCDLKRLLEMTDFNSDVYNCGRNLLRDSLQHREDLTAHGPLEAAYFWSLAVRARHMKRFLPAREMRGLRSQPIVL